MLTVPIHDAMVLWFYSWNSRMGSVSFVGHKTSVLAQINYHSTAVVHFVQSFYPYETMRLSGVSSPTTRRQKWYSIFSKHISRCLARWSVISGFKFNALVATDLRTPLYEFENSAIGVTDAAAKYYQANAPTGVVSPEFCARYWFPFPLISRTVILADSFFWNLYPWHYLKPRSDYSNSAANRAFCTTELYTHG